MPHEISGILSASGLRFAIVASRFNGLIVEPLLAGAIDAIVRTGGSADAITVVRCPGAWELPQVVRRIAAVGGYDAIIALGAVIRGATPHFDYVAGEAAKGLASAAAIGDAPVVFGVLTTDTIEQALERAGTKAGNKGFDAAMTAIEMAHLLRRLHDEALPKPPRARAAALAASES
jgi:6,7-dimethyl-8-ribityllumazine synthase